MDLRWSQKRGSVITDSDLIRKMDHPSRSLGLQGRTYENPRDPVVPSQKLFGVGARRVQVPSEKVLGSIGKNQEL